MSIDRVRVRELAAWGLDEDEYRRDLCNDGRLSQAASLISARPPIHLKDALLSNATAALRDRLEGHASRSDLNEEMAGLEWSLGVVDLRLLLAFQRRIVLRPAVQLAPTPAADDWSALLDLSFGPTRPAAYDVVRNDVSILLRSGNPNLQVRLSGDESKPIMIHSGSPFFEVARYQGRWFLRDGYHRAYMLLCAGVFQLPAVIVFPRTLEELGASQPWFFPEETLFSSRPPCVTDFLDDQLTVEYDRPALLKTLRITVEESFAPAVSGENI